MAETTLTDAVALALSATTEAETGAVHLTVYEKPYAARAYRLWWHAFQAMRRANDLRAYKDGALTFGVRAGRFMDGDTARTYAGATAQALTDDATNYVYISAAGTLTKNTTGFPLPSATPHVPLASIVCASGAYALADVVDYRGRAIYRCLDALTAALANEAAVFFAATDISGAEAQTLTGAGNADALHVHAAAGITAGVIAASHLAAAMQAVIPGATITAAAEAADVRAITVQVTDAAGVANANRFLARVWIAATAYAVPDATGNTVAVTTGTIIETKTAHADYVVLTDAAGKVVFNLTVAGAATRYVMVEIDGRVYASAAITFAA